MELVNQRVRSDEATLAFAGGYLSALLTRNKVTPRVELFDSTTTILSQIHEDFTLLKMHHSTD